MAPAQLYAVSYNHFMYYMCPVMKKQYKGFFYDWISTWMLSSILSLRSAITLEEKGSRNMCGGGVFHCGIMHDPNVASVCSAAQVKEKVGQRFFNVQSGIIHPLNPPSHRSILG